MILYFESICTQQMQQLYNKVLESQEQGNYYESEVDSSIQSFSAIKLGQSYEIAFSIILFSDGTLYKFTSIELGNQRRIESGILCQVDTGNLHYTIIQKRFDLQGQLIEDNSFRYLLCPISFNQSLQIQIIHEMGKIFTKPKLICTINNVTTIHTVEFPKVASDIWITYLNLKSKTESIRFNDAILNPQMAKNMIIRDTKQNMYQIYNIQCKVQKQENTDNLLLLFYLRQKEDWPVDQLMNLLNTANMGSLGLLIIAELITYPIQDISPLWTIYKKENMRNQLIRLLMNGNFVKWLEGEALQQYVMLLQQFFFTNNIYINIMEVTHFLINFSRVEIDDCLFKIIEYELHIRRENYIILMHLLHSRHSERSLKLLLKLIEANDVEFRSLLAREKVCEELLLNLQSNNHINSLLIKILSKVFPGRTDIMLYITKSIQISNQDIEELIDASFQFMIQNDTITLAYGINLIQLIYDKSQHYSIFDKLVSLSDNNLLILSQETNFNLWLLQQVDERASQLLFRVLLTNDDLEIFFIQKANPKIIEQSLNQIIDTRSPQQLIQFTHLLDIYICIHKFENISEYFDKTLRFFDDVLDKQLYVQCLYIFILNIIDTPQVLYFIGMMKQQPEFEGILGTIHTTSKYELAQEKTSTFHAEFLVIDYADRYEQIQQMSQQKQMALRHMSQFDQTDQLSILSQSVQEYIATYKFDPEIAFQYQLRIREARKRFQNIWHHYNVRNKSVQWDGLVNEDTIFKVDGYKWKINRTMVNGIRPILKQCFERVKFYDLPQIELCSRGVECTMIRNLESRSGWLQISDSEIVFRYSRLEGESSHVTLRAFRLDGVFEHRYKRKDITTVQQRIYVLNRNALEFFFRDGQSLYLVFTNQFNWPTSGQIAVTNTLEYLLCLNSLSCRSFNDLTRYPVFPWILRGDASDFDASDPGSIINQEQNFRNLALPMGACGTAKRLQEFIDRHEAQGYFYGTHYSSQAILSQYLLRLEPFTTAAVHIQDGKFDIPDRLFRSIQKTWQDTTEEIADVRELIPEFYYLPEMFLNLNGQQFGKLQNGQYVNNVKLPFYANKNPFIYIVQNRMALESQYVEKNIGQWVDLIWGFKQRGPDAETYFNVFYPLTYSDFQDRQDFSQEAVETQVAHFGQTPEQLFTTPQQYTYATKKAIQVKSNKINRQLIFLGIRNNKIYGVSQKLQLLIFNEQLQFISETQLKLDIAPIVYVRMPICIYGDYLVFGGQADVLIRYVQLDKLTIDSIPGHNVTAVGCNSDILWVGTNEGVTYQIEDWKIQQKLIDFDMSIDIILVDGILLLVVCQDEILLYNAYSGILMKALHHPSKAPIYDIGLSHKPLLSIVFSSLDSVIYSYSINGFKLASQHLPHSKIYVLQTPRSDTLIALGEELCHTISLPFMEKHSTIPLSISLLVAHSNGFVYNNRQGLINYFD